jgi:hypothetical protein
MFIYPTYVTFGARLRLHCRMKHRRLLRPSTAAILRFTLWLTGLRAGQRHSLFSVCLSVRACVCARARVCVDHEFHARDFYYSHQHHYQHLPTLTLSSHVQTASPEADTISSGNNSHLLKKICLYQFFFSKSHHRILSLAD